MAASASLNWQKPASWFNSTPRFLAAQRSAVSSLREEVAQRNPLEGVPLDSSRNRGAASPSDSPGLPGTEIFPVGRGYVLLSAQSSGVRQIWKTRLGAKQISSGNFFARAVPPQGFLQSKNALRRRKTVSSLLGSLIVERIAYQIAAAIQKESAS